MTAMTATIVIFAITYVLIIAERLEPTGAAALGGVMVVLLGLIPQHEALEAIDLNVVFLLTGMMIVVGILSETGLFEWVAVSIAKKSQGNGLTILIGLLASTCVLSAFLDNVTTVVLMAPVTILITQILGIRTIPFLILEAVFSNVGGTATLIGDPPNILIGSQAGLTFNQFLAHLSPIILIVTISALLLLTVRFWGRMRPTDEARAYIEQAHPERAITQRETLRNCLVVVGLIFFGFVTGPLIHVEPGLTALAGAMVLTFMTGTKLEDAFKMVDWNTIFLLIGLFMLVAALEHNGLFEILADHLMAFTEGDLLATTLSILWLSGILSAALGSVPVVMALIPLTRTITETFTADFPPEQIQVLWWALALGCCLGGCGTILGAAANIVVVQIARRNNYHMSFRTFARYGLPTMFACLLASTAYLYLRYFAWG